jgi:hypothetical protein
MSPSFPSQYGSLGPPRLDRRGMIRLWGGVGGFVVLLAIAAVVSRLAAGPASTVYGGGPSIAAATWTWDGSGFTRAATGPGPSSNETDLAFDQRGGVVVAWDHGCTRLVMGFTGGCQGHLDRTWTWDGRAWQAAPAGHSPKAVDQGAMLYDARLGEVVYLNREGQLWAWDGRDWRTVGTPGEPRLTPPGSVAGSAQLLVAAGYDEGRDQLVIARADATWTWDGARWTEAGSGLDLADGQSDPRAVYDAALGRLAYLGKTRLWSWDGTSWQPQSQPGLSDGALGYDPTTRTAVVVRQDSSACDRSACAADVSSWDGTAWTRLTPGQKLVLPLSRSGVTDLPVAFDPARGVLVLFVSAV